METKCYFIVCHDFIGEVYKNIVTNKETFNITKMQVIIFFISIEI